MLVILTICCSPSPFGTFTSALATSDGDWSNWAYTGIQAFLLSLCVWVIIRHVRWPTGSASWWDAGAYAVLAILNLGLGVVTFQDGAPPMETRLGTPDWGYRLDAGTVCAFGTTLLILGIREVVRLRRQSDPEPGEGHDHAEPQST
ncbi:hypothetical protein ACFU7D_17235 [Nocardioides sp. NPDC057577]|uniref:hypothetical protein n=1 Tax=Nocardioides sp. NPDC057577 TaxID=3346171 RepID=UPI00366AE431